jgi:hypothetical protein
MQRLTLRSRGAAAAAVRRLTAAAGGSGSGADPAVDKKDSGPRETFFGLPPPGFDATTHFGFQTVAQEVKEGLVAQVMTHGAAAAHGQNCSCLLTLFAAGISQGCR